MSELGAADTSVCVRGGTGILREIVSGFGSSSGIDHHPIHSASIQSIAIYQKEETKPLPTRHTIFFLFQEPARQRLLFSNLTAFSWNASSSTIFLLQSKSTVEICKSNDT